MSMRGARYLHVLVPCPLGWGIGAGRHHQAGPARAATAGCSRSSRPSTARSTSALPIRAPRAGRGVPAAAEALRAPVRRARPARPASPRLQAHRRPQHRPLRARRSGRRGASRQLMDKPFAITLDVEVQPGQPHRHLAHRASGLPRPAAAVQPRLPGRRAGAGLAVRRRGRRLREGLARLVADNPFPAVMGRVCYHPCETACNRAQLDRRSASTRSSGSSATRRSSRAGRCRSRRADTGRRVLVVGAGPAGLSAAYQLRRLGHGVEIHEPGRQAGGMMRYGIPTFRLPRDVLDAEIAALLELGITLRARHHGRPTSAATMRDGRFRRRLPRGRRAAEPPRLHPGRPVRPDPRRAVACCARWQAGERPQLGRRVVVYGGGNTAMDAARTARRLGADEAMVVYRRTRDQMPANDIEVRGGARARACGCGGCAPSRSVDGGRLTVEKMELDDDRRAAADRRVRGAGRRQRRAGARPGRRPLAARRRARR